MKLLLIERDGTDLYSTLYDSDTSRAMLRFYHPVRHPAGVEIQTASLGSALSLTSELRWYIQRYVDEVLFTEDGTVYLTWSLADEVYRRGAILSLPWPHRFRYRIHGGKVYRSPWDLAPFGAPPPEPSAEEAALTGVEDRDLILEVWSTAEEYAEPERGEPIGPAGPPVTEEAGEQGEPPEPESPGEPGPVPL
ncbi:MAG TPA: DUF5804 family protein [Methanomicrobiales archaeon]|nr:DUF5804 family protein [Methanomicrobiales archaeon]